MGWGTLSNGDLLQQAEKDGYEVLVTTDQNLKYQQNLAGRTIAIVVLSATSWPRIQKVLSTVMVEIDASQPGGYTEIKIPYDR